jgi:hypothetical protein
MRTVEAGPQGQLERAENTIQYVLAVVVPALIALMLYSYVLFDFLFTVLLLTAIFVAFLMILPARKMHRLHFMTWHKNTMPMKLTTSAIGMIYIAVVSVFSVSLLSLYKGLNPENPLTFAVVGGLLAVLLIVLSYNSKNKVRFQSSEKRFFERAPHEIEGRLIEHLSREGHEHRRQPQRNGARLDLPACGLTIRIMPLDRRCTEVLMENINEGNFAISTSMKSVLEA